MARFVDKSDLALCLDIDQHHATIVRLFSDPIKKDTLVSEMQLS